MTIVSLANLYLRAALPYHVSSESSMKASGCAGAMLTVIAA